MPPDEITVRMLQRIGITGGYQMHGVVAWRGVVRWNEQAIRSHLAHDTLSPGYGPSDGRVRRAGHPRREELCLIVDYNWIEGTEANFYGRDRGSNLERSRLVVLGRICHAPGSKRNVIGRVDMCRRVHALGRNAARLWRN